MNNKSRTQMNNTMNNTMNNRKKYEQDTMNNKTQ